MEDYENKQDSDGNEFHDSVNDERLLGSAVGKTCPNLSANGEKKRSGGDQKASQKVHLCSRN